MIYLIFGKDTFRAKRKLKEIVEKYQKIHKSGLNLKILDLKEKNFEDFEREFNFSSMFSERKLLILKNASQNNDFQEKFLKKIEKFEKSREIIFFFEENDLERNLFFERIKKQGRFQEFKPLDDRNLKIWLRKEFKSYGVKIEEKAIDRLVFLVGNDLWQMTEEIKKLVAFKKGEDIKEKDVEVLISSSVNLDIFKTIDAISTKNKKAAFKFLHQYLKKGEKPGVLFFFVKNQFRNLIQTKDLVEKGESIYRIKNKMGLHPFVFEKIIKISQKFTTEELKKTYQKIFNFDSAIKTGKIEPDLALDLFLAEL
jgi:DNA polymerase-3 subunit delta